MKIDCIHNVALRTCDALTPKRCKDCAFRVPHDAAQERREAWAKRLRSLSFTRQRAIAEAYYEGAMPWQT